MILKKLGDEYKLYSHDSCIATTQESPHKRLSKQNCDEMFGIIDVGALALEECNNTDPLRLDSQKYKQDPYFRIGYLKGFNKAMELNKDKLFTVEDVELAIAFGLNGMYGYESGEEGTTKNQMKRFIQSLQQTEWNVIVEMECPECKEYGYISECRNECNKKFTQPKLDADGCLILKRK
jgi:hypothetical protein